MISIAFHVDTDLMISRFFVARLFLNYCRCHGPLVFMNIDPSEMKFHYIAFNLHVVYKITNNYAPQGDSNMFCNSDMHIDNLSIMISIFACCHIVLL